ncbi:hypothetical protein ACER0A_001535 [Haloimpatiens sp. FM7315]|uniref:hypothetical protein n=1 Tax=Haloimpatiens sp. FM7315 TaxID=3298609 RepID=UPI0035A2B598
MDKSTIKSFIFYVIGIVFAEFFRKLLKDVHIPEIIKFFIGIAIIIIVFYGFNRVKTLLKSRK